MYVVFVGKEYNTKCCGTNSPRSSKTCWIEGCLYRNFWCSTSLPSNTTYWASPPTKHPIEYKGGSAPPLYWRGQSQVFGQRFAQSKDTASGPPSLAGAVPWCPLAPATLGPPKGPLSFRRGFLLYLFLWPPLTPPQKIAIDRQRRKNSLDIDGQQNN